MWKKKTNQNKEKQSYPTDPNDPLYFENPELWRNPTEEFIANVYLAIKLEWENLMFEEVIDEEWLRESCVNLKEANLLNYSIDYYRSRFHSLKETIFEHQFSNNIYNYIQNGFAKNLKILKDKTIYSKTSLFSESLSIIDIFIPIFLNNSLQKYAVSKEFVNYIIDDFSKYLSSNNSLEVYFSPDNRMRLVYNSLIKVLTYNLSKIDLQLAYSLVSKEYFKMADEQMQLKKEYGYTGTFDKYEKFLVEKQKILTKRLSNEILNNKGGNAIQVFKYHKFEIRQEEINRVFRYLIKNEFILEGESLIDFKAIFNNRFNKMIRWKGYKNELVYFIFLLKKRERLTGDYTRPIIHSFIYTDKNKDIQKEANYLKKKMSQYSKGAGYPKSALLLDKVLEYLEN